MTPPCKDCPDRTDECHATCERYDRYVKARTAARNAREAVRALERAADGSPAKARAINHKMRRRGK